MRICLICDEDEGWGGIGTYTAVLARALAAGGHRVHWVKRGWGEEGSEEVDGVVVHRASIREPSWRRGTRAVVSRLYGSREAVAWARRAASVVEAVRVREGLDVVESPEYHAQGLFVRDVPLVVKLHSPAFLVDAFNDGNEGLDHAIGAWLERRLVRRAGLVTSPSAALADRVGVHARVVPHPVDEAVFTPAAKSPDSGRRILFVGRLEHVKGVTTLVDAFAELPDAELDIVGDDDPEGFDGASMKEHLLARLSALDVSAEAVRFHGAVPRSDLPDLYRPADVVVIPSLWESLSYVCLEAMACGRPVVASEVGGLPEVVTDEEDGLLVPPGDSSALAAALLRVLGDRKLAERLGRAARATIERRFAASQAAAAVAEAYAALTGAGADSR